MFLHPGGEIGAQLHIFLFRHGKKLRCYRRPGLAADLSGRQEVINDVAERDNQQVAVADEAGQILQALLENQAGFYGAQMSAMDNATRNAGDMIDKLTLQYNRARQAQITKELIEIISGAEAV